MVAAPVERGEAPPGAKLAAVPVVPQSVAAASTSSGPRRASRGRREAVPTCAWASAGEPVRAGGPAGEAEGDDMRGAS